MEIKKVGVVGLGLMGAGIAQLSVQAGYETVGRDLNEEFINRGLGIIKSGLGRLASRGTISEAEMEAALKRLTLTTSLEEFADCNLVVEAIIENIDEKRKLFAELDRICKPETILASNTSMMCVIEIAAATKRMDRVGGLHFFNPAPVMKLVEVVKTLATSDETIAVLREFGASLGKTVAVAPDKTGFIVNRLAVPYFLDAIRVYEEGMATREDLDEAIRLGLGHPMGPLTLADMLGLDTLYHVALQMYDEFRESRFTPPPLLKRMVLAGHLGRKTGKGFYDYGK